MKQLGFCLLFLSVLVPTVRAESAAFHPQLDAKHTFILGGYRQKADASFFAEVDNRGKGSIDLGDLGVEDTYNSGMFEYRYQINDKWLISASTYQFNTSGDLQARKDFVFDGKEFEAGAKLDTDVEVDTYIVDVMYKVYGSDRANVMLGGGLHLLDFSVDIEASVFVGEQAGSRQNGGSDILAPLPNLRAQGFYALSPKWALVGTIGWLSLKYEDYDGSYTYIHARTTYRVTERFGVGLGYQYMDVEMTVDKSRGEAGFDIEFSGPALYLAYSF